MKITKKKKKNPPQIIQLLLLLIIIKKKVIFIFQSTILHSLGFPPGYFPSNDVLSFWYPFHLLCRYLLLFFFNILRVYIKVYVDCDSDIRLSRVIHRDIEERGRDINQVLARYNKTVLGMFVLHLLIWWIFYNKWVAEWERGSNKSSEKQEN